MCSRHQLAQLRLQSRLTVLLDSKVIGKTPLVKDDIDVGEHGVAIRYEGYYQYEGTVKVSGGKLGVINAKLEMIDTGPTPAQLRREQKEQKRREKAEQRRKEAEEKARPTLPGHLSMMTKEDSRLAAAKARVAFSRLSKTIAFSLLFRSRSSKRLPRLATFPGA